MCNLTKIYEMLFFVTLLACDNRADVTFLLDTSGSVGRKDFRKMIDYVGYVVEQFSIGPHQTQVAIVSFSSQSHLEFPLNAYDNKRDLMYAISSLPYIYGDTNTAAGLRTVRSSIFVERRGDRPGIKNFGAYSQTYLYFDYLVSINS